MVAVGHPRAGRVSPYHTRDTIPAIASADLPATLAPPAMPARIIRINVARVGEAAAAALPRLDAEVALQLDYINGALEGREYILGNELTAADIQLSFVGELAAARFGIAAYPDIEACVKRFQARPAYQAALARGGAYSFAS
jgi:glutathione S-transferase